MNRRISIFRSSLPLLIALVVLVVGCVTKRITWSPDGEHAAIIGEKGLYLCDTNGKISELLGPGLFLAEWFPDSQRLAVVRGLKLTTWVQVLRFLDVEEQERIERVGNEVIKEMKAGREFNVAFASAQVSDGREKSLLGVYLRSIDGVKRLAGNNADFVDSFEVNASELCIATYTNGSLSVGAPLASGIQAMSDVRIAPGGKMIAYTAEPTDFADDHEFALKVVPSDGSHRAVVAAEHTSASPDWTPDGHSLAFIQAVGSARGGDQLRLGSLARVQVIDADGKINVQQKPVEFAGLLFDESAKVRCLPDGRIVFSAVETHLPATVADFPQRQQLYAFDPERQATLTALIPRSIQESVPESLVGFEFSQDSKMVSFAGRNHTVVVVTLSTGTAEVIQSPVELDTAESIPVWRTSTELSFISVPKADEVPHFCEVALWNAGKVRTLSKLWPKEVRVGLLDK